jgi:DNA polymerase-3 subunit epsilon
VLDPLVLDRWVDKYRPGKRRLGNVVAHYGVALDNGELHTAEVDVLATLDVLEAIAAEYPAVGSASLDELHAAQVQAHRDWAVGFNNWLASKGKVADVDPTWL